MRGEDFGTVRIIKRRCGYGEMEVNKDGEGACGVFTLGIGGLRSDDSRIG